MAEETVDALVLTTRFDESGLDRSAQQQIAGLQAFVNQINRTAQGIDPVEFDVSALATQLEAAGGDVAAFFAGVKAGVDESIGDFQRLAAATQQVQPPDVAPPAVTDAGNQQLRILAALVDEERQLEQQVGDLTGATAGLEAQETALAASMARQSQAAAQAGAAAQVQADAVLRAQQTAAQAQRLAAAVGQQIVAPTVRVDPNVLKLAQGYIQATQAAQRLAQAQIGLARTTDPVAAGMARASAGANAWAQGLANIQRNQKGIEAASTSMGRGLNKVENALTGLLLTTTGVPPVISGLANALIGLGVTSVPVLGVLAGVAAIAAAYSFFTQKTREAREATEDFIRAQVEASRSRDPVGELKRQIVGVPGEIEGVVAALTRLQQKLEELQKMQATGGLGGFQPGNVETGPIKALEKQVADAETALREASLKIVEATRARVDALLSARIEAERDAVRAELSVQQAGIRLRDQQLRNAFEQEEATREQFFAGRIALAREAAAAEVATLRQERAQVAAAAVSEQQQPAQRAKLDALDAAIRLRQVELGIQLDQITAEEERGRAAAQLLPIQQQLADLQARREATTQAGVGTVEFDTDQAQAQLETLDTQLQRLAQFAEARPDLGFDTTQARASLDALRAQLAEIIATGADADTRLDFDTSLASAKLDALEAQARQTFLTARTEAARQAAMDVIVKIHAERATRFQQEVQRQIDALDFSVKLSADTTGAEREVRERLGIPIPLELDTQAAINEAERLRDEIGRRIAAAGGEAQAAPVDVTAFEQLTRQIQAALDAPFKALLQGADQAREALASGQAAIEAERALLAGAGDPGAGAADVAAALTRVAPLVTAIEQRYREVNAQLLTGVRTTEEQIALQREQAQLAEDLRRIQEQRAAAVPADLVPSFGPLEEATKAFIEAKARLDAAKAAKAKGAAQEASKDLEAARAQMEHSRDAILAIAAGLHLSNEETTALNKALAKALGLLDDGVTSGQKFAKAMGDVLQISSALANSGLVKFTEDEQRALDGLLQLGDAAARFAAGDIVGGISSAIGAIGSLLGGPSEHDRVVAENTRAVRENSIRRAEGFEGIGGAVQAANLIAQAIAETRFLGGSAVDQTGGVGIVGKGSRQALVDEMEALGLSFEQLQRVADEFGIQILDKNGRLVGDALKQLEKEIRAATAAAFAFHAGLFEDQATLANLRSRAQGVGQDPSEIFRQQLEAAAAVGATVFDDLRAAFSSGDADRIRAAELALIDAWEKGAIDLGDLKGLSPEDFFAIINSGLDAADAIDQLGEASSAATDAMLNIPRGFRQAALAFEAQDPSGAGGTIGIPRHDVALPLGGDGDSLPALVAAVERLERIRPVTNFDVVINGTNKNGDDLLRELLEAAERQAGAAGPTFQIRAGP